jgi:hypothetical protein
VLVCTNSDIPGLIFSSLSAYIPFIAVCLLKYIFIGVRLHLVPASVHQLVETYNFASLAKSLPYEEKTRLVKY